MPKVPLRHFPFSQPDLEEDVPADPCRHSLNLGPAASLLRRGFFWMAV